MRLNEVDPSFGWVVRSAAVCVCSILACLGVGQHALQAQTLDSGPLATPEVPSLESRPAVSDLEFRDLTRRTEGNDQSIASLLESSSSFDGTIEVMVGRSRILTFKEPLAKADESGTPVVAVGDPTVLEFDILGGAQMARILGSRVGFTDFSVITQSGQAYNFEVRVVYDLKYLNAYIKQLFPNAEIRIHQMYEHVMVEGEASSTEQAAKIIQAIQGYLASVQTARKVTSESEDKGPPAGENGGGSGEGGDASADDAVDPLYAGSDEKPEIEATLVQPQIVNLIRVPGVQQVMLQVRIAEINRTALRRMGSTWFYQDSSGRGLGVSQSSATPGLLGLALGQQTTAFAVIPNARLEAAFDALRNNQVANVLAEPNLMAMHGQKASFLAGGEFPVPVPQGGANNNAITIQFKKFGVLLDFVPYIMDDGSIRLHVAPEVSTIDQTIGVVSAGISVPGVNTRRANSTVEMRQGQTLALAGLLQVEMEGNTARLPGMGDLPYIGKFFSNNSHERVEKELVILVSPYMAAGLEPDQVGPLPGCEIRDPDDHELFQLGRIESRHPGIDYRAVNGWDDPKQVRKLKLGEATLRDYHGPFGFSR